MNPYLTSIILFLVGIGTAIGAFFLVRLTYQTFKEKRRIKGIGFGFTSFLVIIITLTLFVAGAGWIIIGLK